MCPVLSYSAKLVDDNEITPQSNYVDIYRHGACLWSPRFELSVSRCNVDVTWFPFDVQKCELRFRTWRHKERKIINISTPLYYRKFDRLVPSDAWNLTCACYQSVIASLLYKKLSYRRETRATLCVS